MTPHISAPPDAFATDVIMPGDPLRARRIANTMLDDAQQVTAARGMEGNTGTYNGTPLSVMASGMGIPSISIYATELYRHYSVQRIIRVGTCGSLQPSIGLRHLIIGTSCGTDSNIAAAYDAHGTSPTPSPTLSACAICEADSTPSLAWTAGQIFTTDAFYNDRFEPERLQRLGVLAVEMEAAGLYYAAMNEGHEALTILTTTDLFYSSEQLTADERQDTVDEMVHLAMRALTNQNHARRNLAVELTSAAAR